MTKYKHLEESRISGDVVYEGLFFKVHRDQARLPDGGMAERDYVAHPGAAAIVPLFPDERILVERQYRYAVGDVFVEIPAGKRDAGEDYLATARRELVEETGWRASEWAPLTTIHPAIGMTDEQIDIFIARDMHEDRTQLDHGEFVECDFVTLGWLMDEIHAGRLTDPKTQVAVHWMDRIMSGRWPWPAFTRY